MGVSFVSLASISEPDLVLPALAQAFELKETPGWLPLEHLKAFLRDKHLLLLLDNFEQVSTAAPLLVELLQACLCGCLARGTGDDPQGKLSPHKAE